MSMDLSHDVMCIKACRPAVVLGAEVHLKLLCSGFVA